MTFIPYGLFHLILAMEFGAGVYHCSRTSRFIGCRLIQVHVQSFVAWRALFEFTRQRDNQYSRRLCLEYELSQSNELRMPVYHVNWMDIK